MKVCPFFAALFELLWSVFYWLFRFLLHIVGLTKKANMVESLSNNKKIVRSRKDLIKHPEDTICIDLFLVSSYRSFFKNTQETVVNGTAQKMKSSIKDFFSKCDQIRRKLRFGHIYWRNPKWKTSFFCAASLSISCWFLFLLVNGYLIYITTYLLTSPNDSITYLRSYLWTFF